MEQTTEREVFGITYDRAALKGLQEILVRDLGLASILENPSAGAKAAGSLYSVGFALAGCDVTLVNPEAGPLHYWDELDIRDRLTTTDNPDSISLPFPDHHFDLAWNFVTFATLADPDAWLREMIRVSRRYIFVVCCNNFQSGYPWHRVLHLAYRIPWRHSVPHFNYPWNVKRWFRSHGLEVMEAGTIDSPPWPDPVGFRDIRMHKRFGADLDGMEARRPDRWIVPMMEYLRDGEIPTWIRMLRTVDLRLRKGYKKLPVSHLFYVLARLPDSHDAEA